MSTCRGQWSHDTERNVCALCGGTLSAHKVYVDWMARTTMDQREAANFIPPADPWRNFVPAGVEPPFAMSGGPQSGIPQTARAIMNLVPERRLPLTEKQQTQGEGVARAVDRLSQHEPRLGCDAWRP